MKNRTLFEKDIKFYLTFFIFIIKILNVILTNLLLKNIFFLNVVKKNKKISKQIKSYFLKHILPYLP